MKAHSGIELIMDVTNKTKVLESMENNEVDFALVSITPTNLNIEKIDLLPNILCLIGNNSIKIKKGINLVEFLKDLPLIFREKGSGTRQIMEKFIENNNFSVRKKMELTTNEAVKQALLAGLGFSIMPLIGIKSELQNHELQIIPIKGLPITSSWSLIWLKNKKHSPVSLAYLEFLKKEKNNIVQEQFNWYQQL